MTRYSWADDIHDKVSPANPQRENGGASSGTGSAAPNIDPYIGSLREELEAERFADLMDAAEERGEE